MKKNLKYLILGAAGFIGKNLIEDISGEAGAELLLFDREEEVYPVRNGSAYRAVRGDFETDTDFFELTRGIDVVYHLISTTLPNSSNENLAADFSDNVVSTIRLLDACVKNQVKKVMFISSGGTVYGAEATEPVSENSVTNPISA
ncbi:MAG: NAD-dependent epimerase/dehydratase family protein, partial [Lachnospiraceae bacterium]|nr:NAD-dependent epimerase/dehydratase family protein [Lachnospiraceae bacterium]